MLKSIKNTKYTIGILGGGQLAKMTLLEAYRMGLDVAVIEKEKDSPAGNLTKNEFVAKIEINSILDEFIKKSDIITLESEFVNPEVIEYIERTVPVFPSAKTIKLVQDKFIQKTTFANANIKVPSFASIENHKDLEEFGEKYSYPFVIKTRTMGYDGYGNYTAKNIEDAITGFNTFVQKGAKVYAEAFVHFEKELAIMVVRNPNNEVKTYPVVETVQQGHICKEVYAPAQIPDEVNKKAIELATKAVETIDGVGVFGVELFLKKSGEVLVNEIAPRPHNSGHYTIEACVSSQFENLIRAITNLNLGSTELRVPSACMINILGKINGSGVPYKVNKLMSFNRAKLHLYGKEQSRTGRKMGHLTVTGDSLEEVVSYARKAENVVQWEQ